MGPMPCAVKGIKCNIAGWFRIRTDTTRSEKAARWGCLVDVSGLTVNGCGQPGPGQGRTGAAPSHDLPPPKSPVTTGSSLFLFLLEGHKSANSICTWVYLSLGLQTGGRPKCFGPPRAVRANCVTVNTTVCFFLSLIPVFFLVSNRRSI